MKNIIVSCLLALCALVCHAQGSVRGKIVDKDSNSALSFVNVAIYDKSTSKFIKGSISDEKGLFYIDGLSFGGYRLELTFLGYKTLTREFVLSDKKKHENYKLLYMSDDTKMLEGVVVTAMRSPVKLEVDRKSFDVSQDILNAGGAASDVLENIPSVEVDIDGNISLRGNTSVEVWINGKASGLTSDNRAEILQQLPAESIERIEVIDNPSAKFSAEGSAGIINIVLKKNRKAGYYGSLQAGGNTRGGANTSGNINFNSGRLEGYANVGYRHRNSKGKEESYQEYLNTSSYQTYNANSRRRGNNLFSRLGLTWHATDHDDLSIGCMTMLGGNNSSNPIPYRYGTIGAAEDTYVMLRRSTNDNSMRMFHGDFNYRHNFSDTHFIDFTTGYNNWRMNQDNFYQDSTEYLQDNIPVIYNYQYRPMKIKNRSWEVKLDYENKLNDHFTLQSGYQGNFNRENSPQESFVDNSWDGNNKTEDTQYYNRFIYDIDIHAMYATASFKFGKIGIMGGLRGEYWKVHTESYDFWQEEDPTKRDKPFEKDYLQLFPSLFMSYQITDNDQLQINYTRRLRRPWGGELNSFKNTSDASIVSFGNPELTPEYSNSFSLNYLKTWKAHSLLLSAYYRPTTDVIQRVNYQNASDGLMYSTSMNVTKSVSSGLEMVLKNQICNILNITTTANAYYYRLDGFRYEIDGQEVTGEGNSSFTWNARMQAALVLPYDISLQLTGRYRSREVLSQGFSKSNISLDFGARKTMFNKKLTLALNCRDILNTRCFETYTSGETFTRYQKRRRNGRTLNMTLTWNFGNMKAKKMKRDNDENGTDPTNGYGGNEEM